MIKETLIQRDILTYLEVLERQGKAYVFRNNSFSGRILRYDGSAGFVKNKKSGSPDIVLCFKGQFIGLEVKTEVGKQSPKQKDAQKHIEDAGGKYFIVRSKEDAYNVIDLLEKSR